MNLSSSQLQTLKTWLMANAVGLNDQQAADALNVQASPNYWVFRSAVKTDKAREALVWTEILASGAKIGSEERWSFDTMTMNGDFDPGIENNRNGLATIFAGAGFAGTRSALLAASARLATLGEKVLSTVGTGPGGGNGSAATASAVMGFWLNPNGDRIYAEGPVTAQNVVDARNS